MLNRLNRSFLLLKLNWIVNQDQNLNWTKSLKLLSRGFAVQFGSNRPLPIVISNVYGETDCNRWDGDWWPIVTWSNLDGFLFYGFEATSAMVFRKQKV